MQHNTWYANHKSEPKLKAEKAKFFKDWNDRNKEHRLEYARAWRKKNPERIKNKKRTEKLKLLADPRSRMELVLRTRLRAAIKAQGGRKFGKTFDLVGFSAKELRVFLEKRFTEGMNWENYGLWHIDHIKPCKLFDLTKASEQRLAFHYTNLQPLWATDNLRKAAKYKEMFNDTGTSTGSTASKGR